MNVYVLEIVWPYDGSEILAVFDSEAKALKSAQSRQKKKLQWDYLRDCKRALTESSDYFVITEQRVQ